MKNKIYLSILLIILIASITGCLPLPLPSQSESEKAIISRLENRFGKEGNFEIVKMEKVEVRGTFKEDVWVATVKTSYFDSTFYYREYRNNYTGDGDTFLEALCKNKYGVNIEYLAGDDYLIDDNNPEFLTKKKKIEEFFKTMNIYSNIRYTHNLSDSDFDNFGRLPSLEDINQKTSYSAHIDSGSIQKDYDSILKDVKSILIFVNNNNVNLSQVNYSSDVMIFIKPRGTSEKVVKIYIGAQSKEFSYDNNFNFFEKQNIK